MDINSNQLTPNQMKKIISLSFILVFLSNTIFSQVGIGTNTPNTNAILELSSTSQGMKFPRLTTLQRTSIALPAKGLTIFDTEINCLMTNFGTSSAPAWKCLGGLPYTVPGIPTSPIATPGNAQVSVAFTAPTYNGGCAISGYTVTSSPGGFTATGTTSPLIVTGLTNGIAYTFTIVATNAVGNSSPSVVSVAVIALAPSLANITLNPIGPYYIVSVFDNDYLPYVAPTGIATLATAQAANGIAETKVLNIQGTLTTTGVTIKIPFTATGSVNLPAYSQTINIPSTCTQDGVSRNVTFSYPAGIFALGSGTIAATLKAEDGSLNVKKLDIQTGNGNDALGYLLGEFSYATNNSGGTTNFQVRDIAGIPDRNINNNIHAMLYVPLTAEDGKIWLNNNLGANYSYIGHASFNPAKQATAYNDFNAYGYLYQWGRYSDGHNQIYRQSNGTFAPTSSTTSTLSSTDTPTSALFVIRTSSPLDWRSTKNDLLWQGGTGTNNPCPVGFRLPTLVELTTLFSASGIIDYTTAANSLIKLPASGQRYGSNGACVSNGSGGYYWSSSVYNYKASFRFFGSTTTGANDYDRTNGYSVRCIKN